MKQKQNRNESHESDGTKSEITRYLEVIVGLLVQQRAPGSATQQMATLLGLGLDGPQIARILGRDPVQVSKDVYKIRKSLEKAPNKKTDLDEAGDRL